ncbi:hypothetical protein PO124_04550 [Bacillus licheniformis]|nr:hypothetical protein [Bacillus licheniformis]
MVFLTWFPTYLVNIEALISPIRFSPRFHFLRHLPVFCCPASCPTFDQKRRIGRGCPQTPIITGLFLSISIIGANYVDQTSLIICL